MLAGREGGAMGKETTSAGQGAVLLTALGAVSQLLGFGYRVDLARNSGPGPGHLSKTVPAGASSCGRVADFHLGLRVGVPAGDART